MKRIVVTFIILLTFLGGSWGQKNGKVLWETEVDRLPYYSPLHYFRGGKSIEISELGNTVLAYPDKSKATANTLIARSFDKDGKIMWKNSDFYKNKDGIVSPYFENGKFVALHCIKNSQLLDSTILFDENYNYSRSFNGLARNANDGVFYRDFQDNYGDLIKYDSKGKEQWRYKNSSLSYSLVLNTEAPYGCLYHNPNNNSFQLVRLDENGKEISISEPFILNNSPLLTPTKKGAWVVSKQGYENRELIRFNEQGKKIATIPYRNIISKEAFESNTIRIRQLGDENLVVIYLKNNEFIFSRIDSLGNIKTINSGCMLSDIKYFDKWIWIDNIKNIEGKDLMYAIELPEANGIVRKYKIGVFRFDTPNLSWQKEITTGASTFTEASFSYNRIILQPDNTFIEISSDSDYSSLKSLKVYDINGSLKWKSDFKFYNYQIKVTDDYLYANIFGDKSNLAKIRYDDGKIIWQKEIFNIYDFNAHLQADNKGNNVIFYQDYNNQTAKYSYKLTGLNNDGSINWTYILSKDVAVAHTSFGFSGSSAILNTLEPDGSLYKNILRKISPCNDLNALSITGNTEACPTEKVKLSVPKQDGITYQWQKDGKDIPNVKDVVYDFGESGTYAVVAKDEFCQNTVTSNALKINIRSLPTAEITAPKSIFCDGEKTTIASKTNGTFFQWQKDGKDIINATSGILEVSQAGDYRVGVQDDKCPQVGYSNIYTIITKLLPEASISTDTKGIIYEPFTVKMTANTGTGLAYQWLKDDAIIPDETKATYEAKKSGKYNVSVSKDGCTKLSDALTISILIPLANSEEVGEEEVKVYPNPSKGEFKIILPKSLKSADVQLFDVLGRERFLVYVGEQAQAEGLGQGVYFLRVSKGEKTVTSKLIIE